MESKLGSQNIWGVKCCWVTIVWVLVGFWWFSVILSGSWWVLVVLGGSQGFLMVFGDSWLFLVVLPISWEFLMILGGFLFAFGSFGCFLVGF